MISGHPHLLMLFPHPPPLTLSFLICKLGMVIVLSSYGYCENENELITKVLRRIHGTIFFIQCTFSLKSHKKDYILCKTI